MKNKRNIKYLPSIDALRALAVISVIIYHINPLILPGGFLGVDLFFVISGYLITSLLINEYEKTGKINLIKFYIRRARRLLPALYFMITFVLIFMVIFNKFLLEKTYLDSLFGYFYLSNWWYIFHKINYFDKFSLSTPFKHLWSLAIEEQYYLLFPIIFLLFNKISTFFKKNNILKYFILILILLSIFLHIYLLDFKNVNRVYFGTDTRIFSILIGALFAVSIPIKKLYEKINRRKSLKFTIMSLLLLISLLSIMIFVNEYSRLLYPYGFVLFSVLSSLLFIFVSHQNTIISRLFSFKPLVYIGKISYSMYLWHFPIIILVTSLTEYNSLDNLHIIITLILIIAMSCFSYYFIEKPIRDKSFIFYIKDTFLKLKNLSPKRKKIIIVSTTILSFLFLMGIFGKSIPILSTSLVNNYKIELANEYKTDNNKENKEISNDDSNVNEYNKMLLIGDSLAINIGEEMTNRFNGITVDGKVSRQAYEAVDLLGNYENYNTKNSAIIYVLGTNGVLTEENIKNLIEPFQNADIYFVNVKVPRVWETNNNKLLENSKEKYSNITVIDWYSLAKDHPEYFSNDNVHLKENGVIAMVDLIQDNLKYDVKIDI